MPERAHWQVQEAKQRFSEVLRAVEKEGPQTITRHGEEVAVVIDIAEYRKLTRSEPDGRDLLLGPPYFDDDAVEAIDQVEANRKKDFGRPVDIGADL